MWALFLLCVWAVGGLTPAQCLAQTSPPGQETDALGSALARLPALGSARAVIVADDTSAAGGGPGQSPSNPVPSDPPADLDDIARQFHLQRRDEGAVTVLAPVSMVVLNDDPGEPRPYFGLSAPELTQVLIRSLSPQQWGLITGNNGIGYGDLSSDQRALFEQIVVPPFPMGQLTAQGGGAYTNDGPVRTLTARQCLGVRLQLALNSQMSPVMSGTTAFISSIGDPAPHGIGDTLWAVQPSAANAPSAADVPLRQVVPNIPKPGRLTLDAKAAAAPVPLAVGGVLTRTTVGALVARIGAATGTELYADARLAPRPLWVRGPRAPAADLLNALCLCVTGAVRRVGPAYVLTDDVVGIGAREARLADWLQDAADRQTVLMQRLADQQGRFQPPPSLTFSVGDPLAGETDLAQRLFAKGDAAPVDIATLGPAAADAARRIVQAAASQNPAGAIRADQVQVSVQLDLTYLVPGIGAVEDMNQGAVPLDQLNPPPDAASDAPASDAPAPVPDLSRFPIRALLVPVADPEDVTEAIHLAQRRGMTELWIEAPPDQASSLLQLAASHRGGLRLRAVVSLLSEPSGSPDADLNVEGQSSSAYFAARAADQEALGLAAASPALAAQEWRAEDAAAVSRCVTEAAALDRIAGVEGVVVAGTCPPGYLPPTTQTPDGQPTLDLIPTPGYAGDELGYTPDERLRFLRRYHVDPVDLTDQLPASGQDLSLPLFPLSENTRLLLLWHRHLARRNEALVASLGAKLPAASGGHPAFIQGRPNGMWFGTWDKPDLLPDFILDPAAARRLSHVVLGAYAPGFLRDDPTMAAQALAQQAGRSWPNGHWDGFVVDCFDLSVSQAAHLLSVILPAH